MYSGQYKSPIQEKEQKSPTYKPKVQKAQQDLQNQTFREWSITCRTISAGVVLDLENHKARVK